MRNLRTAVLAGVAALGVAGTAVAATQDSHVMRVALPDGSVARVEYRGDVAPRVVVESVRLFRPIVLGVPVDARPFADFDRVLAEMDRASAAMLRQAQAMRAAASARAGKPDLVALRGMPAGTVSYRIVSTRNGDRVCARSWRMTAQGAGQQPKLISASSGDCDGAAPPASGTAATKTTDPAPSLAGPTA